ncbi:MAG: SPOR domain-containing protein [Alphaproteobacteria bacterium]|nr:SPOR domain-containing protein [Alphaproteobacteria bacterium]
MIYLEHIFKKSFLFNICFYLLLSSGNAMQDLTIEERGNCHQKIPVENPFVQIALTAEDYRLSAEELISRPRVQLFSLEKVKGKQAAHQRLEEMRKEDPRISYYCALIVSEKGSRWNRGQIGPFANLEEAKQVAQILREVFTFDLPCPSASGIIHQKGFELEDAEIHNWEQE